MRLGEKVGEYYKYLDSNNIMEVVYWMSFTRKMKIGREVNGNRMGKIIREMSDILNARK